MVENNVNTGVLQLVVLKRLVVLKGPTCDILWKWIYWSQVFIPYYDVFKSWHCRRLFSKMEISQFCHDVTTQRAAAPPVVDPLILTWHSVINNYDILYWYFIQILYVNSQYNWQNSGSLYMLFPRVCTKLSMLSINFWDNPRIQVILSIILCLYHTRIHVYISSAFISSMLILIPILITYSIIRCCIHISSWHILVYKSIILSLQYIYTPTSIYVLLLRWWHYSIIIKCWLHFSSWSKLAFNQSFGCSQHIDISNHHIILRLS